MKYTKYTMKTKVLITFAAMVAMMTSCGGDNKSQEQQDKVNYNIITLAPVSRDITYAYPATLDGDKSVNLFPQVEGRILKSHFSNGEFVKKGQTLINIDPTPYSLQVQSDLANVKAAEAALSTAKLQYESQQKLYDKKIVSEYVMKTAQNTYLTAQAQLAQAQAALANSRTNLNHCTLVAPISGVVTCLHDNVGLLVGPSMGEPILSITDQTKITAKFSITEDMFTSIFRHNEIVATEKGIKTKSGLSLKDIYQNVQLRTKDGQIYDQVGTFSSIAGTVDANTGSVKCEVSFPNPNLVLHAGNSASVIFSEKMENVLVIPQTACKKLQDKYLVFKVDENGQAVGVVVDVVPTDDGKEYILSDNVLKAGDEIIADGIARIQEGQKVK